MPLIKGDELTRRFEELTKQSHSIDVAVAWARPCEAMNLLESCGANIRAAVGISNNFTNPSTLRRLNEFAELRVVPNKPPRIFHPKYYCFKAGATICWVGSANMTGGGFGGNEELVHQFELTHEDDKCWFDELWSRLPRDPLPDIHRYEREYKPPKRTSSQRRPKPKSELPLLADIRTWDEYYQGLKAHDDFYHYHYQKLGFDVLGETSSWLHTIQCGREVIHREDWASLTKREYRILSPPNRLADGEGNWKLLGWVRGGGAYALNPRNQATTGPIREQIRGQISRVLYEPISSLPETAHDLLQVIRNSRCRDGAERGIGPAAASRWLALARPDCLVSVNKESAAKLGRLTGLPQQPAKLADNYSGLIDWLCDQLWFTGPPPQDPMEREIWNCRGAMVDVFLHRPSLGN